MKQRPHHHGHRARLRERIRKDSRSLADYELIELLLTYVLPMRDTKPLAKDLLARFTSLEGVLHAPAEELRQIKGFGEALETFWIVLREFQARQKEGAVRERDALRDPATVAELARARFGHLRKEEFWVAFVDTKNRLIAWECISRGTVDKTAVFPREIMSRALSHQASGVILVHNHPGGDPTPSAEDRELTRHTARAGVELDVRVLDHVVVAERGYVSFQERGLL